MRLPIALKFSEGVSNVTEPAVRELPDSLVERRIIKVTDSLAGKRIDFVGLQATITDVLVRVRLLDGSESTTVARPSKAWVEITGSRGLLAVASSYALLGIEHILFGVDHLLFVLGLLILVKGWRRLVGTITAFTVAHSITLAAATLGFVHVPPKPVEATIALSIVFVACEIIHRRSGRVGSNRSLAVGDSIYLWSLARTRLRGRVTRSRFPQNAIPLALLFFNVGVELGQLLFIGLVMAVIARRFTSAKKLTRSNVAPQFAFNWCESDFGLRHRQRRDVLGHPTHRRHLVKTRDLCAHALGCDLAKIL